MHTIRISSPVKAHKTDINHSLTKEGGIYLRLVFCAVTAFFLSGFSLFDAFSPFGAAFICAVPFEWCFAALLGGSAGCFTQFGIKEAVRLCLALTLCCAGRLIAKKRLSFIKEESTLTFICTAALILSEAVSLLYNNFTLKKLFLTAAEVFISLSARIVFSRALRTLEVRYKKGADNIYTVCGAGILILCMSCYTVGGLSAGRFAAFVCVMLFALCKGIYGGCVSGVAIGTFLVINGDFSHVFPMLAAGGAVAGLLSGYGQLICATAFCITAIGASFSGGIDREFFTTLAELLLSFAVFSLLPTSVIDSAKALIKKSGLSSDIKADTRAASLLSKASGSIYQVCDIILSARERHSENLSVPPPLQTDSEKLLLYQLDGIGELLSELSLRINTERIQDTSSAALMKGLLRDKGIFVDELNFYTDSQGSVTVEAVLLDRPFDIDWKKALYLIEAVTRRRFEKPEVVVTGLKTTITFYQHMPYRLQIGYSKQSATEGAPCGDSVSAASRTDGKGFALISDGMGTGLTAAIDSSVTATAMKKLVCSGFSFDSALKIVNSALIARGGEESVASIDALEVNLFSGEAVFYKAGASFSLIRKRDKAVFLEKSSLPPGILSDIRFSKSKFTATAGDIVLLLSDGVAPDERDWIKDELLSWSTNSMDELSTHIIKLAALRQNKAISDDMTVVAIKIEAN